MASNDQKKIDLLKKSIDDLGREMSTQSILYHQAIAEKAGLSGTDHKYVDLFFKHGSMTAGQLAKLTGLTTGAVTGIIDRLEKQELVKRENNPKDRRQVLVVLQQQEALKRIGPAFKNSAKGLEKLYSNFSDEQLETIKSYLEKTISFYTEQIELLKK